MVKGLADDLLRIAKDFSIYPKKGFLYNLLIISNIFNEFRYIGEGCFQIELKSEYDKKAQDEFIKSFVDSIANLTLSMPRIVYSSDDSRILRLLDETPMFNTTVDIKRSQSSFFILTDE